MNLSQTCWFLGFKHSLKTVPKAVLNASLVDLNIVNSFELQTTY